MKVMGERTKEESLADLKNEINNLLWMYLPDSTTIGRAEQIAVQVYGVIENEWDEHRESQTKDE
jgi:hypothetical protein